MGWKTKNTNFGRLQVKVHTVFSLEDGCQGHRTKAVIAEVITGWGIEVLD
jgi:hypothetical protein